MRHASLSVRHAALTGILGIEDKSAIPLLERVLTQETASELKREIERGISYLRSF
jgi:hypothetical protein